MGRWRPSRDAKFCVCTINKIPVLKNIFKTIQKVAKREKVDVYAVGGYVRDELLTRICGLHADDADNADKKTDVDFVVVGSGLEFAKAFDREMKEAGSLVEFPDFDTARYVLPELELEFAGARSEKYDEKSRKPKVRATNLEDDLKRRDFTVNAMAQQVGAAGLSKKIIDPFGGQDDLKKKILRTPLEPNITFSEDPLRMLRAARFAAQLCFELDPSAKKAIVDNCKRIKIISAERIQEEMGKLLMTGQPSVGLWILFDTKLLHEFLPELADLYGVEEAYGQHHKNNFAHTLRVVDNIASRDGGLRLRWAGLLHDVGKASTKKFIRGRGWTFDMHEHLGKKIVYQISKQLRLSTSDGKYIGKMVRWHQQPISLMDEGITDSAVRRLIVNLGDDLSDLLKLCRSDITTGNPIKLKHRLANYDYLERRIGEVIEKDKMRAFQSPVRGEEIMKECGLKPGPTVGKIKKALEEAILDGVVANEYGDVKRFFEEIKGEYVKNAGDWERMS